MLFRSGGGSITGTASDITTILPAFSDVNVSDGFLPAIDVLREYGITSGCGAAPPMYCPSANITRGQMAVFVVRSVMGGDNFSFTTTPYFTDVPSTNAYFPWIQAMRDLNITAGCTTTRYCPDDSVTRDQMAVFVIRDRLGANTAFSVPQSPYFSDVPSSNSYFNWIQKMKQIGITAGCGQTTYCPNDPVTREQMAAFIMRGAFNQLLPANTPVVASISPATASPGQMVAVTVTGQNTNFANGVTHLNTGAGITVSNLNVSNATTLTAQLVIDVGAVLGPRSVTVLTGSEEATLPNGFLIQ